MTIQSTDPLHGGTHHHPNGPRTGARTAPAADVTSTRPGPPGTATGTGTGPACAGGARHPCRNDLGSRLSGAWSVQGQM